MPSNTRWHTLSDCIPFLVIRVLRPSGGLQPASALAVTASAPIGMHARSGVLAHRPPNLADGIARGIDGLPLTISLAQGCATAGRITSAVTRRSRFKPRDRESRPREQRRGARYFGTPRSNMHSSLHRACTRWLLQPPKS